MTCRGELTFRNCPHCSGGGLCSGDEISNCRSYPGGVCEYMLIGDEAPVYECLPWYEDTSQKCSDFDGHEEWCKELVGLELCDKWSPNTFPSLYPIPYSVASAARGRIASLLLSLVVIVARLCGWWHNRAKQDGSSTVALPTRNLKGHILHQPRHTNNVNDA